MIDLTGGMASRPTVPSVENAGVVCVRRRSTNCHFFVTPYIASRGSAWCTRDDNQLTIAGLLGDTSRRDRDYRDGMDRTLNGPRILRLWARYALLAAAATSVLPNALAQETPLLSGGISFFTNTSRGYTTYLPLTEPLLAAPVGKHLMIESRAALLESFLPRGNGMSGYDHSYTAALTYVQGDYIASRHATVVAGSYLVPFGTYNERLSPVWINNLQDGPFIANLPFMATGLGGELRGSALSNGRYSIDYAGFFSARSDNEQFNAMRSSGGRVDLYLPQERLEAGFSYGRLLQGTRENFYGVHLWWEPEKTALRLRSEYARGAHAEGYWIEADYRSQAFGGLDSFVGRFEPVFRIQQTFRIDNLATDGLPSTDTQRPEIGIDYNLPHNARILTSYSRQFSSAGDHNIWETGIVYRFLFPAWKGHSK